MDKIYDCDVPEGYAETMECFNRPASWDVAGIIEDMQEKLRANGDVPNGQILAALDWMTTRLHDCRKVLVMADSELSAVVDGRLIEKGESQRIIFEARKLCDWLASFKS